MYFIPVSILQEGESINSAIIPAETPGFPTLSFVELDFKEDGTCTSIEGFVQLPDSVIPEEILAYVNANYPENFIIEWELEGNEQEVQINSGLELRFNVNGTFLRIDND